MEEYKEEQKSKIASHKEHHKLAIEEKKQMEEETTDGSEWEID